MLEIIAQNDRGCTGIDSTFLFLAEELKRFGQGSPAMSETAENMLTGIV